MVLPENAWSPQSWTKPVEANLKITYNFRKREIRKRDGGLVCESLLFQICPNGFVQDWSYN